MTACILPKSKDLHECEYEHMEFLFFAGESRLLGWYIAQVTHHSCAVMKKKKTFIDGWANVE